MSSIRLYLLTNIVLKIQHQFYKSQKIKAIKIIFPIAPTKPASSQRSGEIEARAGIAFPNTKGPFAPNEKKFLKIDSILF